MLIDYEHAWADLTRFILTKPNHGQAQILVEMARLTDEHRVAEGGLPALLRLYGVTISTSADDEPNAARDALPGDVARDPHRHLTPKEGHAGDRHERAA